MRPRISIRGFVHPLVRPFVHNHFFKKGESGWNEHGNHPGVGMGGEGEEEDEDGSGMIIRLLLARFPIWKKSGYQRTNRPTDQPTDGQSLL